ncbi:hypothetical protein Godav_023351 [Gossypium davidsonii]|uniref:Uncharacterized protein n=1 Tax=Gossypium davidsonii TaxID=34287 RepID=A0A7J8SRB4_GOSDV|nr:hypothetical protein [Gossypium davidsonii]
MGKGYFVWLMVGYGFGESACTIVAQCYGPKRSHESHIDVLGLVFRYVCSCYFQTVRCLLWTKLPLLDIPRLIPDERERSASTPLSRVTVVLAAIRGDLKALWGYSSKSSAMINPTAEV